MAFQTHDVVSLNSQVLFDILPRLCGMCDDECIPATDFREAWGEGERGGEGGRERIPLYCDNNLLHEAIEGGKVQVKGEAKGEDTRSIAHQVSWTC